MSDKILNDFVLPTLDKYDNHKKVKEQRILDQDQNLIELLESPDFDLFDDILYSDRPTSKHVRDLRDLFQKHGVLDLSQLANVYSKREKVLSLTKDPDTGLGVAFTTYIEEDPGFGSWRKITHGQLFENRLNGVGRKM